MLERSAASFTGFPKFAVAMEWEESVFRLCWKKPDCGALAGNTLSFGNCVWPENAIGESG